MKVELDENDERIVKVQSKTKWGIDNNDSKYRKDKEPTKFGFVPVNKNEEITRTLPQMTKDTGEPAWNTITKMFKNAPPPKPKRVIGDSPT